jgi:YVTN family beta-propeller protein
VTTRGVTATLHAPGRPGWVAAGDDALWLAVKDTDSAVRNRTLLRLDLATGAALQRVPLAGSATSLAHMGQRLLVSVQHNGSGPGPNLIEALDWRTARVLERREFSHVVGPLVQSGKDLWALQTGPAALLRLDPRTLEPTAAPIRLPEGQALGLAAGAGYVWTSEPDNGDVLRVGAARSVSRVHVGGFPAGVVFAAGSVWFADRDRGEVRRLDPRTLRPAGKPIRVGGKPESLVRAGGSLFATDAARGTATRIDLRSGKIVGPPIRVAPPAKDAAPLAVAGAGSSAWFGSFAASTLTRVSATVADARLVATIAVPPGGGAFAVGEGAVWSMSDSTSTLLRIDPTRNAVVARIHVAPGEQAVAGEGAVWLTHPRENTVSRIDPKTITVSATIPVPDQPSGVAVTPGAVWVADSGGPSLTRIDPATNRVVATIRVGPNRECCGERMAVIAGSDAVWVANQPGRRIVRVDPQTNKVVDSIDLGHFMPCGFLAADRRSIWAAGAVCTPAVAQIDIGARRVKARLVEPHAVGVALAFGSLWVVVFESGDVDRIDPRTGQVVARIHVGGWPVRIGVGFGSVWVNDDKGRVLRIRPHA